MLQVDVFETDLPADFQELAGELAADADRLAEVYPARPEADRTVLVSDRRWAASPQRWLGTAPRLGTATRVAAAVVVLAGLTLAFTFSSAWRGALAGKSPDGATSASPSQGSMAAVSAASSATSESVSHARPVSISAEALRMSGEEMEILRHATEGEVVEVDI